MDDNVFENTVTFDARKLKGKAIIHTRYGKVIVPFDKPRDEKKDSKYTSAEKQKRQLANWLLEAKAEESERKQKIKEQEQRSESIRKLKEEKAAEHAREFRELAKVRKTVYRMTRGARLAAEKKLQEEEDDAHFTKEKNRYISEQLESLSTQDYWENRKIRTEKLQERIQKAIPAWNAEVQDLRRRYKLGSEEDVRSHEQSKQPSTEGDDWATLTLRIREMRLIEEKEREHQEQLKLEIQRRMYETRLKDDIERDKILRHNFNPTRLCTPYEELLDAELSDGSHHDDIGKAKWSQQAEIHGKGPKTRAWMIPDEEFRRKQQETNEYFKKTWNKKKNNTRKNQGNEDD